MFLNSISVNCIWWFLKTRTVSSLCRSSSEFSGPWESHVSSTTDIASTSNNSSSSKTTRRPPSGLLRKCPWTRLTTASPSTSSSLSTENIKRRPIRPSCCWSALKCSTRTRRDTSRRQSSGGSWPGRMGRSIKTLTRWWGRTSRSTASPSLRLRRGRNILTIKSSSVCWKID